MIAIRSGHPESPIHYNLEVVFSKEDDKQVHIFPLKSKKQSDAADEADLILKQLYDAIQKSYAMMDTLPVSSDLMSIKLDNIDAKVLEGISFRVIELN